MMIRTEGVPPTEFSEQFLAGMVARMGMSFHKYGRVAEAYPDNIDALASLRERLSKYRATGNTEWLMDVANFAMIEFMYPRHDNAHFEATDSVDSPGRVLPDGSSTAKDNTAVAAEW